MKQPLITAVVGLGIVAGAASIGTAVTNHWSETKKQTISAEAREDQQITDLQAELAKAEAEREHYKSIADSGRVQCERAVAFFNQAPKYLQARFETPTCPSASATQ